MYTINEMFTTKFIVNSVVISIISIFVLFMIFRSILKLSSNSKVFFISVIMYTIIYCIGVSGYYIYKNEYIYSNVTKNYITGKIQRVDFDNYVMRMYSNKSTLEEGGTGNITVKFTKDTFVTKYINGKEEKVDITKLRPGLIVKIMCKESEEKNKKVTAIKVTIEDL